MVRVLVCKQDAMNDAYFLSQQLMTQIRRRINEQVPLLQPKYHTTASPHVSWVRTGTNIATTSN